MADGPMARPRPEVLDDERGGGWRRRLHTRLSLLACDEEGSDGHPAVRHRAADVATRPPLRDDDGHCAETYSGKIPRRADDGDGWGLRDGHVWDGTGREVGDRYCVPSLKDIEHAELPDVPHGYRTAAEEAAAALARAGLRDGHGVLDTSTQLERVTQKALTEGEAILDRDLAMEDEDTFGPVLRAKTSVITSVLTTQAKVDETRLRRQSLDRLPALLALVNETAKRLPPVLEHEAQ